MPEFLLDFTATGTARITGNDLASVVTAFKEFLYCYDPGIVVSGDGVTGSVSELSLGLCAPDPPVLRVAEIDGHGVDSASSLDLDTMMTPVACDRMGEDPGCEQVYDEARGDGYLGLCPHCADVTDHSHRGAR
jgi:hypothetical protein